MKNKENEQKSKRANDKGQKDSPFRSFLKENAATLILVVVILLVMGGNWLMNQLSDVQTWVVIAVSVGLVLVLIAVQAIISARKNIKKSYDDATTKLVGVSNELESKISSATDKIETEREHLSKIIKKLGEITTNEEKSKDLLKYIKDTEFLTNLEGGIVSGYSIYVQSSKFILETTDREFADMIYANLRKEVIYHYLIPDYPNEEDYHAFTDMVHSWFIDYSKFLSNYELCKSLYEKSLQEVEWSSNYKELIRQSCVYFEKKLKDENYDPDNSDLSKLYLKVIQSFKKRLIVSRAPEDNFYITTLAYQTNPGKWKAVVKLPTETTIQGNMAGTDRQKYYSFLVFGDMEVDNSNSFIKSFRATFNLNKWSEKMYKENIYTPLIRQLNCDHKLIIEEDSI